VASSLLALALAARAVSTRQFSLDSAGVLSAGKLEGVAVLSRGAVVPSVGVRRIGLQDTGVARSLLTRADGTSFVGSGNQGKIFKVVGDVSSLFAETKELLVTSLAEDASGTLYAGTLPHGKIFAIDKQGKSRVFAQPEGAEHVWALAYDAKKRTLFAATGPHGKIFAIDAQGKADVYYASKASHVMALALDAGGRLFAGTSDDALLLRIDGPGRAQVVYDFEGNEVTALALRDGRIAAAANQFPKPAAPSSDKKKDEGKKDDQQSSDKSDANKEAPKPGTGELWLVEPNGEARKLFASTEDGHITAVEWEKSGAIYAATGKNGHVFRVEQDGSNALWLDVDERQVLALQLSNEHPMFVTGDAGAVYRVLSGNAAEAIWTSKVLDAQFPSRFGQLSWRGRGKLSLQTRSGNTEKPDEAWSEWSAVLTAPGPIRSPAARFLQLRARLDTKGECMLYAIQAYYLPGNQPASLKEITVKPAPGKGGDDTPSASYKLEWKTDNPDGDKLRYRLEYRPEDKEIWRPMLRESEILTKTSYDWNTDGVPDGYYRVRVDASDELENPAPSALHKSTESEPFLVDNHPPHVDGLRYANGRIAGTASDDQGPISKLEYAIDGQEWKPFYPRDDLFDTSQEVFELELKELEKGPHVVAVRTRDARNNLGSAEIWITR
jgi:sugar lactone lactonase YvrE